MADNKNFDSVFADCTKDELEFDVIFDDEDDMLIDLVAGVNEAGIPLTGEDFDFSSLYENDDMVGEKPDFDYQKDGDAAYDLKDAEGTKDENLEIGGEVGDGKVVSGKEDSAMSNAYEVTKKIEDAIGANDKQQTSLESAEFLLKMLEDANDEGPLYNNDPEARTGGKEDAPYKDEYETEAADADDGGEDGNAEDDNAPDSSSDECNESTDYLLSLLEEEDALPDEGSDTNDAAEKNAEKEVEEGANSEDQLCPDCGKNPCKCKCDPLTDIDDTEAREGKTCAKATDAPEVEKVQEVSDYLLAMLEGEDPIQDADDADMRDGSAKRSTSDVEGVGTDVIGAALDGDTGKDNFEDNCDCAEREGDIKHSTSDVEGVKTHVVGSALESANDDEDDAEMREGKADRDDKNIEGVDTKDFGAALDEASDDVDELLAAIEDDDDVDLEDLIDTDYVVDDDVHQTGSHDAEIKTNESADIDELVADSDDDDIKEVQDNTGSEIDVEYNEDDDELIDAVMNGLQI